MSRPKCRLLIRPVFRFVFRFVLRPVEFLAVKCNIVNFDRVAVRLSCSKCSMGDLVISQMRGSSSVKLGTGTINGVSSANIIRFQPSNLFERLFT